MMTRRQVIGWAVAATVIGVGLLGYLLLYVPPVLAGGQPNMAAILLFLIGLLLLFGGTGSLGASALHRRWPVLAGATSRSSQVEPFVAMRQGIFLALAIVIIALLALLQVADIVFVVVTFVLFGLLEAFLQKRDR